MSPVATAAHQEEEDGVISSPNNFQDVGDNIDNNPASEDAVSPSSTSTPMNPACPIDRQWITKLLKKHPNPNTPEQYRTTKALVLAPMVDQSDLPFRMQCRRWGTNLCFTPMIHSGLLVKSEQYRSRFLPRGNNLHDRPLIAQLCGNDPQLVEQAAKMVEPYVDGIDLK